MAGMCSNRLVEPPNAACKAIASLMAAAIACRQGDLPPDLAAAMLVDYYRRDPLKPR